MVSITHKRYFLIYRSLTDYFTAIKYFDLATLRPMMVDGPRGQLSESLEEKNPRTTENQVEKRHPETGEYPMDDCRKSRYFSSCSLL